VPTTFRTATGEVSSLKATMAESPAALLPKEQARAGDRGRCGRRGCGRRVFRPVGKPSTPARTAPPVAPAVAAPVVAPAPSAPKPAPRETPAPPPTQILVRLTSEPAGALVTDTQRGVVIGATPFEQRLERKPSTLAVRLAKDGFANVDLAIPLGGDFEKAVRLERQKTTARRPGVGGGQEPAGSGAKPASAPAAAAAPAAAPPTTPPPAASAAQGPKPPRSGDTATGVGLRRTRG
jgi:hypothetical protein